MNLKLVIKYIGAMFKLEAGLMLLPYLCSVFFHEKSGIYFIITALPTFIIGHILHSTKVSDKRFYSAEGFVTAATGWIFLSFIGAIPFFISHEIPNYIDALFETVSGFTTTGATILSDPNKISRCMNFWRCFTHFVGGMGVLVLMLAIIPTKSENMHIMKAESPGPQVGKIYPKVSDTAKIMYLIYVVLTAFTIICYKISGMPLFDSICIGLGTAGTGGFVITSGGCADYGYISQVLIAIFMLLFGINFNIYYLILSKKIKDALSSEELKVYLFIVFTAIIFITANLLIQFNDISYSVHNAFFQVSSIITTTGFSTTDYTVWPLFSQCILLILMLIGGCAGSTAGGYKISRLIIIIKSVLNEMYLQLHPNSVKITRFENKLVSEKLIHTVMVYTIIYFFIILCGITLISFENLDFATTVSSVFETFNNIGLGISKIGPKGNFSIFNYFSKIVFILLMLTGRLEIFPIIMLFSRKTWRREQ